MSAIKGSTVLITGGGSGIGKMLGERCLKMGASSLVIWDFNQKKLDAVTSEFRSQGFVVHPYLADVSNLQEIDKTAHDVLNHEERIDILFNNAGIVTGKEFYLHTHKEIESSIDINVKGAMNVTRLFLPEMIARGKGHIVNIASAAGLLPNPKMSVYVASKWAIIGWSESLRLELEELNRDLHVTTVTPSYIDTGMFAGVKAPFLVPLMKPEYIADKILKAVLSNKILLREPFMVKTLPFFRGVLPSRVFDLFIGKFFKVYESMTSFAGQAKEETIPEKFNLEEEV